MEERVMGSTAGGAGAPVHVQLRVRRLDPEAPLPHLAHAWDAGLDLCAAEALTLAPGARAAVGTGLAIAVPPGWVGLVHPRSGLALRHGLTVANAPGTIDAGYRGELKVLLVNLGAEDVPIERGDRIAQLVLQQVGIVEVVEVEELDDTTRGTGGFGSSGVAAPR
jgi:dUTP pyrophosphatase